MELCDRKRRILQAVVDSYIKTAEPIGSRTIAKRGGINLSSATIRNEMADLEERGFLEKPHTSAGRVPSVRGYRFYVNCLMKKRNLTDEEVERLNTAMEIRLREIDEIIAETSEVVSRITTYTVIATLPKPERLVIHDIKLLPIGEQYVLLAVIANSGLVKNAAIKLYEKLTVEYIFTCSRVLSDNLTGKSPADISQEQYDFLKFFFMKSPELLQIIISYLFKWFDLNDKRNIYRGGVINVFNHPEYRDIDRAREVIGFLDDREKIKSVIEDNNDNEVIKIKIGSENKADELRDCSLVVANYMGGGDMRGRIGVIGPMRMDYARIVSSLEVVTERLGKLISRMYDDE